jgi:hypothetical protein
MLFFLIEYNVVVLIIHNISYTAISIKVVTDNNQMYNIGAKKMMGIIIDLNKFSISVALWGYL